MKRTQSEKKGLNLAHITNLMLESNRKAQTTLGMPSQASEHSLGATLSHAQPNFLEKLQRERLILEKV